VLCFKKSDFLCYIRSRHTHTHTHTSIYTPTYIRYIQTYILHTYVHIHTHSSHVTSYNRLPQYPLATPLPPNRYTLHPYTSPRVNTSYRVLLCSTLSSALAFTSQTTLSRLQSWQFSVKAVYRGCHDNRLSRIHSLTHADTVSLCKVTQRSYCAAIRCSSVELGQTDRQTDRLTD
jgi:hypothetical protein